MTGEVMIARFGAGTVVMVVKSLPAILADAGCPVVFVSPDRVATTTERLRDAPELGEAGMMPLGMLPFLPAGIEKAGKAHDHLIARSEREKLRPRRQR